MSKPDCPAVIVYCTVFGCPNVSFDGLNFDREPDGELRCGRCGGRGVEYIPRHEADLRLAAVSRAAAQAGATLRKELSKARERGEPA